MIKNFTLEFRENSLDINISGRIGSTIFEEGYTVEHLKEQLTTQPFTSINLNMCSLGGSVMEAINIYSVLDNLKKNGISITTTYIGANASASTIIGMVADKRVMSKHGLFLIHEARTSMESATKSDLNEAIKSLDETNIQIASIYTEKTGKDIDSILSLMSEERWLKASEAKELGLITDIEGEEEISKETKYEISNCADLPSLPEEEKINEEIVENTEEKIEEVIELNPVEQFEANTEPVIEPATEPVIENKVDLQEIVNLKDLEITNYVNEITNLKLDISNYTNEIASLKNQIKEKEIDEYLTDAVAKFKISANLKENYKKLMIQNFADTKELVDKMVPTRTTTLFSKTLEANEVRPIQKSFTAWTIENPEELKKMKESDFEQFNEIFKAEFGRDYSK